LAPAARSGLPEGLDDLTVYEFPSELGTGALYLVVANRVLIRGKPSLGAEALGCKVKGQVVELFEWDVTRLWRRTVDPKCWFEGWMMLDHAEHGALLRPHGLPLQDAPVEPICAAIHERSLVDLRRFLLEIDNGANVRDYSGRTALMLAGESGLGDFCVLLLAARADVYAASTEGLTAIEMVPPSMKSLIQALSGQAYDARYLPAAIAELQPEVRGVADNILKEEEYRTLSVRYRERQQSSATEAPSIEEPPRSSSFVESSCQEVPTESSCPDVLPECGVLYEVVYKSVPVRSYPFSDAEVTGARRKGHVVELHEFDATGKWRRIESESFRSLRDGWIRVHHDALGDLLRPVDSPS